MPTRVVIVGGSFGGLTTAYELRDKLTPDQCEITLISQEERFTFVPSLPWVAMGSRSLAQISFPVSEPLLRRQVRFAHQTVVAIDPDHKVVSTDQGQHAYDFLVLATGHRSANEAVPGLGPFDGPGHSLMSAREAQELRSAVAALVEAPGPVVVGAAPGASCIGPAYEFAFELDHLLRRRQRRSRVAITFVTPEPFLGHMGMGGAGKIRQLLEGAFEERDIRYLTSAAVSRIGESAVQVEGTGELEAKLAMVIPPLAGVPVVAGSPGLANPKGFVAVDARYRHPTMEGVYAVGVAVAMAPAGETPVPVNFPKTAHMTEQMGTIVALDIAARIGGGMGAAAPLVSRCVLDMGDRGVYMSTNPVRPPRDRIPKVSEGKRWLWAKRGFERVYLWHARRGRRVPTTIGW